jgi:hypothetical protein
MRNALRHAFPIVVLAILHSYVKGQEKVSSQNLAAEPSQNEVKPLENAVAKLFTDLRAGDHLPALKRINNRTKLRQQTCSVAVEDKVSPNYWPGVFYKTENPSDPSPELSMIASKTSHGNPKAARYSVTVWPTPTSNTGHREYWVGISVYMSAGWEFVDNWFTDDISYKNNWKKGIDPKCRTVH